MGLTISKFYSFLGPNLGVQFLKYHYEDGNGSYLWQDSWHLGSLLLKYGPRISNDSQYCECKGLIRSQLRKLKLAASRVSGIGSYSGQVFEVNLDQNVAENVNLELQNQENLNVGGQHEMLLNLLYQRFSSSSLPGNLTNRLCSIPRRPDTWGA